MKLTVSDCSKLTVSDSSKLTVSYCSKLAVSDCFKLTVSDSFKLTVSDCTFFIAIHIASVLCRFKQLNLGNRSEIDTCSYGRVIHKSLRDFRPLRCSSRDGHAERQVRHSD
jgi:hypothetical protein